MKKLPSHFMVSDSDGSLYDTRVDGWSYKPPLRPIYSRGFGEIRNCHELKAALRHGPHAWPGCYPLYFIASDGEALSFEAVKANLRSIMDSIQNDIRDGWRVVACDVNWEDSELYCAHTNKRIPSAYGDDESLDERINSDGDSNPEESDNADS